MAKMISAALSARVMFVLPRRLVPPWFGLYAAAVWEQRREFADPLRPETRLLADVGHGRSAPRRRWQLSGAVCDLHRHGTDGRVAATPRSRATTRDVIGAPRTIRSDRGGASIREWLRWTCSMARLRL